VIGAGVRGGDLEKVRYPHAFNAIVRRIVRDLYPWIYQPAPSDAQIEQLLTAPGVR